MIAVGVIGTDECDEQILVQSTQSVYHRPTCKTCPNDDHATLGAVKDDSRSDMACLFIRLKVALAYAT
ncbi:hypothetical protein [Moraxella lacunata]|uniref:hypothetical protein n=1 Tax=Moraxella lacunata TaxID=477 RepID=UPI003EE272A9